MSGRMQFTTRTSVTYLLYLSCNLTYGGLFHPESAHFNHNGTRKFPEQIHLTVLLGLVTCCLEHSQHRLRSVSRPT